MIKADYHFHSAFSTDGISELEDMVLSGISRGLKYMCITEHMDYDSAMSTDERVRKEYPDDATPFVCDTKAVYTEFCMLKEKYKDKIRLNFGMELGLHPRLFAHYKEYIEEYPFDFLIGSSHEVYADDPYYPEYLKGRNAVEAYREYFKYELLCAKELKGCFDVYGHIDYALRYNRPVDFVFDYGEYADILNPLLETIVSNGSGIELNTGGFSYFKDNPNPHRDIIKKYRSMGGEIITIGSDAHKTQDVGRYFEQAKAILEECGFRYYTVFEGRKPKYLAFDC